MPWVPIENVGQYGIMRGQLPQTFPPNAWTQGSQNVDFEEDYAFKAYGESVGSSPAIDIYAIYPAFSSATRAYALHGVSKVRGIVAGVEADITRSVGGDYVGTANHLWTSCMLNDVYVATNFADPPQVWNPISLSQRLVDLPNWPTGYKVSLLRSFKNYLIAMGWIDNLGTYYARVLKTSHPAAPGEVPLSWDPTDPTMDATETPLPGGEDHIIGGEVMGDAFMIYTDKSCYAMTLSGTNSIFNIRKLYDVGAVGWATIVPNVKRKFHVVWTREDVVIHDGITVQSIVNPEMRDTLANLVDAPGGRYVARAVKFERQKEIWFTGNATGLQEVCYTWNWETGAWGHRSLPQSKFIAPMPYDPYTTTLHDFLYNGLLISSPAQGRIFKVIKGGIHKYGSSQILYTSTLSRTHLTVSGYDGGKVISDPTVVKMIKGVRPRFDGFAGHVINVTCNAQMDPNGAPLVSSGPHPFIIGTTHLVEPNGVTGRYFSIYFDDVNIDSPRWKLQGYDLEVIPLGGF